MEERDLERFSAAWRERGKMFDWVTKVLVPVRTTRGKLFWGMLNRWRRVAEGWLHQEMAIESKASQEGAGSRTEEDCYSKKVAAEISAYKETTNVHDLPPIHHYWAETFLMHKLRLLGIQEFWNLFVDPVSKVWRQDGRLVEVASLGAGNCDFEIEIAKQIARLEIPFRMDCYEVNPAMLDRGKKLVQREGLLNCF
jgi:hypothetical protein